MNSFGGLENATVKELRVKHLEMVQAVITRLTVNSFLMKGWSITVVSALFVLSANETNSRYTIVALLPAFSFWGLDAYYVRQERIFRALYEAVRVQIIEPTEKQTVPLFSMDTDLVAQKVAGWFSVFRSKTVFGLHAPIITTILVVTLYAVMQPFC